MTEKQYYLRKNCLNCQHWQRKTLEYIDEHYDVDKPETFAPQKTYDSVWKCELDKSYDSDNCCENFILSECMKKQIKSMGFNCFEIKEDMVILND